MTVQRSRDALWRKRIAAMQRAWSPAREGDPKAIHGLRVASRRIRETLPVVSVADRRRRRVKRTRRKMRALTRLLGPVRERDVSLTLLARLEEEHPENHAAIDLVRETIVAERKELHDEVGRHLDSVKLEKLVRKLARVAGHAKAGHQRRRRQGKHDEADDRQWRLAIAARVARRAKQLKEAAEDAGALYAPNRLHGVRVLTKKLRYALEVGHEARVSNWQREIRALKEVQDVLGQLQDREVLNARMRDLHVSHNDGSISAAVEKLTRFVEDDTRRDHALFVSRRDQLLKLCSVLRQQATHAIPIGRPHATRVALRPGHRATKRDAAPERSAGR